VARKTDYSIEQLEHDIAELFVCNDKLAKLKEILPEFNHQNNC